MGEPARSFDGFPQKLGIAPRIRKVLLPPPEWRPAEKPLLGERMHFMGVGGCGMSALASASAHLGAEVTGCDARGGESRGGVERVLGHDPDHVTRELDALVHTSAVDASHPELARARELGVKVVARIELLRRLSDLRPGVLVTGTHGKTTTTLLCAHLLAQAGREPLALVGADVPGWEGGFAEGRKMLVAELDESDPRFAGFHPRAAVVTNIDDDHLDRHGGKDGLRSSFAQFLRNIDEDGFAVVSGDDAGLLRLARFSGKRTIAYGLSVGCEVRAVNVRSEGLSSSFDVLAWDGSLRDVTLSMPGVHNVRNALAAVALGLEMGVREETIRWALESCPRPARRFQLRGDVRGCLVVDDYAHHPTEVASTISAARALGAERVLVAFQPHRYSRTHLLAREFARALGRADRAFVLPVYGAGEENFWGVTGEEIARGSAEGVEFCATKEEALGRILNEARAGDVLFMMGAGDVVELTDELLGCA